MANNIKGKVWSLDTALGVVSSDAVCIHAIQVRFTTAGAGSLQIMTNITADNSSTGGQMLLDCTSVSTSTANAFQVNQLYTYGDQTFSGIKKILSVNVESIYLVTGLRA